MAQPGSAEERVHLTDGVMLRFFNDRPAPPPSLPPHRPAQSSAGVEADWAEAVAGRRVRPQPSLPSYITEIREGPEDGSGEFEGTDPDIL